MSGILYIVATPIGNLNDLTMRAAQTFEIADFIAAEDTRVTLKLLNHLGLKKPLISYRQHNQEKAGQQILRRISLGENCALCSDAGTPAVSDPGEQLVISAHQMGIRVVPIPGACAAIAALCVSGQLTSRFCFEGFISQNKRVRTKHLASLLEETRTLIFYEAPHKLTNTLNDLMKAFGETRSVTICREITKLHEEIFKTTFVEAYEKYKQQAPRGEFVLVVEGIEEELIAKEKPTIQQAAELGVAFATNQGLSQSEAAKLAASETGHPKSAIYKAMLAL